MTEIKKIEDRTAEEIARFILREAAAAGVKIGTDGNDELVYIMPKGLPDEVWKGFSRALGKNREAIIAAIVAEHRLDEE
jgi:hypothetical protein